MFSERGLSITKIIKVDESSVAFNESNARVEYNIEINDEGKTYNRRIWFEADGVGNTISQSANGIVIGLIPFALLEGYDIETNLPMNNELLSDLNNKLIPKICNSFEHLHRIRINSDSYCTEVNGSSVGTELSLDIESLSTVVSCCQIKESRQLTDLIVFNMHSSISRDKRALLEIAKEYELSISFYNSNIFEDIIGTDYYSVFYQLYKYSMLLVLGNKIGTFICRQDWLCYFDSSFVANDINAVLSNIVINDLKIVYQREKNDFIHKIQLVTNHRLLSKSIAPCIRYSSKNCGWCCECKNTLLTADIGGCIDRLSYVFNIEEYKKSRKAYLLYLYANRNNPPLREVYLDLYRDSPKLCSELETDYEYYSCKYNDSPDMFASIASELGAIGAKRRLRNLYYEGRSGKGTEPIINQPNYEESIRLARECLSLSRNEQDLIYYVNALLHGSNENKKEAYALCLNNSSKVELKKLLAYMYCNGKGVLRDDYKAFELIKRRCSIELFIFVSNLLIESSNHKILVDLIEQIKMKQSGGNILRIKKFSKNREDEINLAMLLSRCLYRLDKKNYNDVRGILSSYSRDSDAAFECMTNIMLEQKDEDLFDICLPMAELGNHSYQYKLALCFKNGWGCNEDIDLAIMWLKNAVYGGSRNNPILLLVNWLIERGNPDDLCNAFILCTRCIKINPENSDGWGILARLYRDGKGTEISLEDSINYYTKAYGIDRKWVNELSNQLMKRGNQNDLAEAFKITMYGALKGDVRCQVRLSNFYKKGLFVKKNIDQSVFWARIASESGKEIALKTLNSLPQVMTKTHYDVGLVTFWFANNYGAILTAFALYRYLQTQNYKVLMIEKPAQWWPWFDENRDPLARKFASQYFELSLMYTPRTINELNELCDKFIVGSDQMWNYYLYQTAGHYTYLDFASEEKKKVAFATSFGHNKFFNNNQNELKQISSLMKRFNSISTREESGVKICKELFDIDATCNVDSVFLCESSVYDDIADRNPKTTCDEDYIFAYILDGNEVKESIIRKISSVLQKKVILVIDGGDDVIEKDVGMSLPITKIENVGEWLDYLRKSSFVITDSFHGTCFSIIYNKKFISIRNKGRGATRFDSILMKVELLNRMVDEENYEGKKIESICQDDIDYEKVNRLLSKHVDKAKEWLKRSMSDSDDSGLSRDSGKS